MSLTKITLTTGKTITIRNMLIADYRNAAVAAGKMGGTDQLSLTMNMGIELAKILIVDVDGRKLSSLEKENLDSLFTINEFVAVNKLVSSFLEEAGTVSTEIVPN